MSGRLSVTGVSYVFPAGRIAARDITLMAEAGQLVGVVGANGGGKSTLARLIVGSLTPTNGTVTVVSDDPTASLEVAYVSADPDEQLLTATVFDELAFALRARWLAPTAILARIQTVASLFDVMELLWRHPGTLSVGEQLRVLVAAAVARQPAVLILDEVSSMMDGYHWARMRDALDRLRAETGLMIVTITHRLEDLTRADSILVLYEGSVVARGDVATVFAAAAEHPEWRLEVPLAARVASLLSGSRLAAAFERALHLPVAVASGGDA